MPEAEIVGVVATKQITVEEFESMSLEGRWELISGKLVGLPYAVEQSSATSATIAALLGLHVRANRLGRVYSAAGGFVLFPDRATVRVPNVAFVRADRAPQGEARNHFPRLAPDLAIEVLSPSERMADAISKVAMYLDAGVQLIWLVHPERMMITVFRADCSPRTLGAGDTLDGGEVVPGFSVPLAEIFED